jgi:uncharacterized membrane protein
VSAVVRGLDAAALLLALVLLAVLVTGGLSLGGVALRRPEDVFLALLAVVALRALAAPVRLPPISPRRAVVAGVVAYAAIWSFIALTRHFAFQSHALDLGQFAQITWSIAHGDGPWMTLPTMHAWGDHFSPILYLLAPLAWLVPIAPALLIVQSLALAGGALVVFAFARRHVTDERLAAGLALLYLANPSLHGINVRDVHVQAFAVPLLMAAALAHDSRRWGWCAAALILVASCREDAAVPIVGFAVWLALARGRWRAGAALAALAVLVLVVDTRVLIPYYRAAPYTHLVKRWAYLGDSVIDVLITLVARPWRWVPVVVQVPKLVYLLALLAPLGFLPLLAPLAAASALPSLAVTLLSFDRQLFSYRSQYTAFVLPFLMLAAVEGCAVLEKRWARRAERAGPGGHGRLSPGFVLGAAFLVSLALTARSVNDLAVDRWRPNPERTALRALLARIPDGVPVSVNERLVPHLATRHEAYIYNTAVDRSAYVLDTDRNLVRRPPPAAFAVVARGGGWTLLQRTEGNSRAEDAGTR